MFCTDVILYLGTFFVSIILIKQRLNDKPFIFYLNINNLDIETQNSVHVAAVFVNIIMLVLFKQSHVKHVITFFI